MSASPVVALRKAVRTRLLADAALVAALGGAKVYDETPRGVEAPLVLFGDGQMRDWSGQDARGAEHFFTLVAASAQHGQAQALAVAQRLVELLDESPLALEGHALIDLRFLSMDMRRDANGRFARVSVLFRATTEYL
jgi:hypothetical protein